MANESYAYGTVNRVNGNFFEGLGRGVRKIFKKKKKYHPPSPSQLIGDYNKQRSPLSSKRSFFLPVHSAKILNSKVINGKRI